MIRIGRNRAMQGALALLAAIVAALLWRVWAGLPLRFTYDPNEGWNAYHAASAMAGGPLYPAGYFVNNYPPLSFYVVGPLGRIFGDAVIAGRVLSLLSFLFVGWGIFAAARKMGAMRDAAFFAALVFAASLLGFTDYVAMNDPQLFAHALAVAGFLLVLEADRSPRRMAAAALLFALAFFVKHNVIAMAAASALWLLRNDKRAGVRLIAVGAALGLAGLILFRLVYGVNLLAVVATARRYSLVQAGDAIVAWLQLAGVLALAAMLLWRRRCNPFVRLCALYAAFGIGLGVYFIGGAGVDPNAMFDADIALCLCAALTLSEPTARRGAVAFLMLVPVLWGAWESGGERWLARDYWLHPSASLAVASERDIAFIAARKGPALCALPSFCYWAGKPADVDVFNIGEAVATGARGDGELVRRIDERRYAVIQLDADVPAPLGKRVHAAMLAHYRLDHADDCGNFYVPVRE
jgi:hypothetical protein